MPGIIDAKTLTWLQDMSTAEDSHSVDDDARINRVFVPVIPGLVAPSGVAVYELVRLVLRCTENSVAGVREVRSEWGMRSESRVDAQAAREYSFLLLRLGPVAAPPLYAGLRRRRRRLAAARSRARRGAARS